MVWDFIQNQLLGMHWFKVLIQNLFAVCGLDLTSPLSGSIIFFIYDVIKIAFLLFVLIFIIFLILKNISSLFMKKRLRFNSQPLFIGLFSFF